jgi:hypothetical protein
MADLKISMKHDDDGWWEEINIFFQGCPYRKLSNHRISVKELLETLAEMGVADVTITEIPTEDI